MRLVLSLFWCNRFPSMGWFVLFFCFSANGDVVFLSYNHTVENVFLTLISVIMQLRTDFSHHVLGFLKVQGILFLLFSFFSLISRWMISGKLWFLFLGVVLLFMARRISDVI